MIQIYCNRNQVSQEIVGHSFFEYFVSLSGCGVVLYVGLLQVFVDVHDGSEVAAAVTVVGSREDG